jgi:hypothetical protein
MQIKNINGASRLSDFFGVSDPNDFLSQLVTMDETWLYSMTRRQSNNQWSGGIAAHLTQKNSKCKNELEKILAPMFLGSRWHPPHWLSSKGPNYQCRVLLICWCS